jgi:hypothetical protein
MNPRCAVAVTEAALKLGRKITKAELNDIELKTREMSRVIATKDPAAWRGMTRDEQMKLVGASLSKKFEHDAAVKARQVAKDTAIVAGNMTYLQQATDKGMTGARALMHKTAFIPDGKGGVMDAESRAKAVANEHMELMRPLIELDKDGSLFGLLTDEKQQMDVLNEYHGKSTGNAAAKKAADSLRNTIDTALRQFNDAGGNIARVQNYLPQRQDQYRVSKNRLQWVKDAYQNIDRNTLVDLNGVVLDDAKATAFLNEASWSIATDGFGNDRNVATYGGSQSVANRHKQHRQLHWKNPEAYMNMQKKYGAGNVVDQVKGYIEQLAHETVLMETFGSNALHQIDLLKQKAKEIDKARNIDPNKSLKLGKTIDSLWNEYTHFEEMVDKFAGINQGVSGFFWVNRFFSNIKNMNISTKLGSILTSQLADNGTAIATARALNIPLKDWANMKARGYTDAEVKRMAQSNAIAFDIFIDNIVRFGDSTDASTISGKLAQTLMKVNGSNYFTQMHRTQFAALVESNAGQLTRQFDWNNLPAKDKAIFEGKGFTELDWNIMKAATPDPETGLLGMSQLKALDVESIKKMMPNEIAKINQDAADFIQRMEAKNIQESGWVSNRQKKFDEYRVKIQELIDSYIATRDKNKGELGDEIQARIDLLDARRNEADVRLAALTGDVAKGVEVGSDVQKAIDATREARMRLSKFERKADREIFKKAVEFEKRIDKRMAELDDFMAKFDEKAQERNKWSAEYAVKVGSKIEAAAESARRDAYLKLTGMALQEAEMAVLQPGLYTSTFVPLRKGEVMSELGGSVLQFKSFAIAFFNSHLINRAQMMDSPLMYRLSLLATTSVLGGIGLMMNDIAQGKDPREIMSPEHPEKALKFGMQAIVKGGGLSIAGDLLNVFMEEGGRSAVEQLSGPFMGQVSKTLNVPYQAFHGNGQGTAKAAINLGREFIPFNNLIWTRAVWNNYLMAELNEIASPGYKGRMRGLAEKNYGQEYFLGMGVEPRLPNMMNVIGQ